MNYSYHLLEFDKIIHLLNENAKTHYGKSVNSNLKPQLSADNINHEFKIIKEIWEFLHYDGNFSFEPVGEIENFLSRSKIDQYFLSIDEILELKKGLYLYHQLLVDFNVNPDSKTKYPLLFGLLNQTVFPDSLFFRLNKVFDAEGNVSDHASDDLKRIRKRKTNIRGDIQGKINKLFDNEFYNNSVQDKIITIREGRFVIPIKSQYKSKMKANTRFIMHSYSKSGETAFVEPEEIILLNNEMIEIDEAEMNEIRKILIEITDEINQNSDIIHELFQNLGRIESYYSRARFTDRLKCSFPIMDDHKSYIKLKNAYHPLLGLKSIPIDIDIGSDCQGIIISGPNAGGKTVALKTAGLLSIMAMSAIPIPASNDSKIGIYSNILAEIGDEQSISENLSSFSGHILNISKMIKLSDDKTLILIDEIASSTEPKEGEALGREIINFILNKGAQFIITTHFQGIKELALLDRRMKNAFVEFDEEHFIPLYRLHTGGTGSSYALKAALKYGLPDSIVQNAEEYIKNNTTEIEYLIKNIESEKNSIAKRKNIIAKHLGSIKEMKYKYELKLLELQEMVQKAQKKEISVIKKELSDAREDLVELRLALKNKQPKDMKSAEILLDHVQTVIQESEREETMKNRQHPEKFTIGQRVFVGGYQKEGYIESIGSDKVKVRIGLISLSVDPGDLFMADPSSEKGSKNYHLSHDLNSAPVSIDIRGIKAEEAMKIVEKNLDLAVINGLSSFSIIHGKGEGILRKLVWDLLKNHPNVSKYDFAKPEDGGQGKTIVYIK